MKITPIIIGAMGTMFKGFDTDKLDLIDNKFDKFLGQKIDLLGTAHIVRSFLKIA